MNQILLSGLSGTNPLGAMAAFGLLRVLEVDNSFDSVALSWTFTDDWNGVLHVEPSIRKEELVEWLVQRQRGRADAEFVSWSTDVKVHPNEYREQLHKEIHRLDEQSHPFELSTREDCDFFAAYGTDVVTARSTGDVKPTAFHMTAGQQRFLKSARELAVSIDPAVASSRRQTDGQRLEECRNAVREALFGPWRYQDKFHSLGWDPTTEGLYALSDISPSEAKPRSVRAAVWLAFESLPVLPCVPRGGRLVTTGFDPSGEAFTWPLWHPPLRLDSVRSLLASPEFIGNQVDKAWLNARGIGAIYRSRCLRDDNGRGTFRNAVCIVG